MFRRNEMDKLSKWSNFCLYEQRLIDTKQVYVYESVWNFVAGYDQLMGSSGQRLHLFLQSEQIAQDIIGFK